MGKEPHARRESFSTAGSIKSKPNKRRREMMKEEPRPIDINGPWQQTGETTTTHGGPSIKMEGKRYSNHPKYLVDDGEDLQLSGEI